MTKYTDYIPDDKHKNHELEQEKEIYSSILNEYKKQFLRANKKQMMWIFIISIMFSVILIIFYLYFLSGIEPVSEHHKSLYLIQNLRGDTVNTWVSWKKFGNGLFHIHVQNSQYATKERLDVIIDVIMSRQKLEIDDSLLHKGPKGTRSVYYAGWYGALNSISDDTKFTIPKNLHFHVDDEIPTGDIMINLTDLSNPDGYSAYTKSIVDSENHQILKSTITVYNIDKISLEDLKTLVLHEIGHGFGLAHSTAPEDLMAPVIATDYPYISECDLDAIHHLYDGGESSNVVCEK
jgi:hypothetical protein